MVVAGLPTDRVGSLGCVGDDGVCEGLREEGEAEGAVLAKTITDCLASPCGDAECESLGEDGWSQVGEGSECWSGGVWEKSGELETAVVWLVEGREGEITEVGS